MISKRVLYLHRTRLTFWPSWDFRDQQEDPQQAFQWQPLVQDRGIPTDKREELKLSVLKSDITSDYIC
jgi:hypothetical protein